MHFLDKIWGMVLGHMPLEHFPHLAFTLVVAEAVMILVLLLLFLVMGD
jgi:Mg2+ and Co2+ transporter CorA